MTALYAALFRRLFPLLSGLMTLAALGLGIWLWLTGQGAIVAVLTSAAALITVVSVFGALALQIETNAALRRPAPFPAQPMLRPTIAEPTLRAVATASSPEPTPALPVLVARR